MAVDTVDQNLLLVLFSTRFNVIETSKFFVLILFGVDAERIQFAS